MFIAMNRFKIVIEKGKEFEEIWKNRTSSLKDVPGFVEFHLVKGSMEDDHILYASHTIWKTKKDYQKRLSKPVFYLEIIEIFAALRAAKTNRIFRPTQGFSAAGKIKIMIFSPHFQNFRKQGIQKIY